MQRAVIMADGKRVTASDLELTDALNATAAADLEGGAGKRGTGDRPGRPAASRGKITSAALELGISRPTLYELMEKLGIARE